jgi:hypothetical protein
MANKSSGCLIFLGLILGLIVILAISSSLIRQPPQITNTSLPVPASTAVEAVIAHYGPPHIIDSTEYDKPRPLMVTKWLIYKKQKVKLIFVADAPFGSPPPYSTWKLIGAIDTKKNINIDPEEVDRRMFQGRRK